MKMLMIATSILMALVMMSSCINGGKPETSNKEDVADMNKPQEEGSDGTYQDQATINEIHGSWYLEYRDSIESQFQNLISALPQYEKGLNKEKAAWQKYQKAVREVADCEDCGSSTSMFVDDVLRQGINLRETSFCNLYLHIQGKAVSFSTTTFTEDLVADAYSAFIKAVGDDEYQENKPRYQEALREEQQCWNDWMECRKNISQRLATDLRYVYDKCTNQMMRTKLLQLKNQNHALGICGHEEMECVLPYDCSDKVLLDYPGFDIVWAKHCLDTDWYPEFK